jgi:hypothetical protein
VVIVVSEIASAAMSLSSVSVIMRCGCVIKNVNLKIRSLLESHHNFSG